MKGIHSIPLLILIFFIASCKEDSADTGPTIQFPVADFDIGGDYCTAPCITSFTSTSTGGELTLSWDFGNGNSAGNQSYTSNTFTQSGVYDVKLTVQNAIGTDEITKQVTIQVAPPQAAFTVVNNYCVAPCSVTFSSISTGEDISLNWDFGDGSTAGNVNSTSHFFSSPGVYNVKLTAENDSGTSELTKEIFILEASLDKVSFGGLNFTQLPFTLAPNNLHVFQYTISNDLGQTIESGSFQIFSLDQLPHPALTTGYQSDRIDKPHTLHIYHFLTGQSASFEFTPQLFPPDFPLVDNCKDHALYGNGIGVDIEFCWHED